MKDKKTVKSLEDVRRPQLIRLNDTQPGERYIIRVMDGDDDSNSSTSISSKSSDDNDNWLTTATATGLVEVK